MANNQNMRSTLWNDFKTYVLNSGNTLNKLLAINLGVFVLFGLIGMIDLLSGSGLDLENHIKSAYISFPSSPMAFLHRPWSVITYQFTHEGFFHILYNMMVLFMAGRILREFLGDKKLLNVYLLGGVAGAAVFMLAMNIFPVFAGEHIMVGASASVIAVLAAAATLVPNYTIYLILLGPVRLVYIMLFFFLIDLLNLGGADGVAHFAHLGGAVFGFVYIRALQNGNDIGAWLTSLLSWAQGLFKPKPNMRVSYRRTAPVPPPVQKGVSQDQIDAILDKIAKSGYDSLNQKEKDILFKASKDN